MRGESSDPVAAVEVTVATYNVHRCIGTDGICDPERVAAVISEIDADFVSLQEISFRRPPHGIDQLERIAEIVGGYHAQRMANRICEDGEISNGLLSRHRPSSVRSIDLSCRGCEARGAISATFRLPELRLLMIATHFGLRWRERRRQARLLAAELEEHDADLGIVAGDLNDWIPTSPNLRALRAKVAPPPRGRATFPSWLPMLSLDEIWVSSPRAEVERTVWRTELSRVASDHLPLRARITLPPRIVER